MFGGRDRVACEGTFAEGLRALKRSAFRENL
jgi:hypothetical protein